MKTLQLISCRLGIIFSILITTTSSILALDPNKTIAQYGHSIWMRQNGLPANSINCAIQTRDGYIWIGTSAGLFHFDGVRFEEVATNPIDSSAHERIVSLCESNDSSLWVGTAYNGLRRYTKNKMIYYDPKDGYYQSEIRSLLESRSHRLWIGTSNGLYKVTNGKFELILISPNYITSITEDLKHRIWVGTHQGVRVFLTDNDNKNFSITRNNGLPNNITTAVHADHKNNVWIGTENGLVRWNNGLKQIYNTQNGLSNNHITTIFDDNDGNIWVGTRDGLNRFTKGKWTNYKERDGLTHNNVLSFCEDNEGSFWVCTLEGLNLFKDVNITTFTTKEGLAHDEVSSILEAPDRSLFFLHNTDASVTHIKKEKIIKYSIPIGPAYISKDQSLWITQNGFMFNIKNDKLKQYDTTKGIPAKWISAITEDEQSLIIYIDDIGVRRFVGGKLKPYLMNNGEPYSNPEYVVCFYYQPGILWIGTTRGLVRIKNGVSKVFTIADGLAGRWISSIYDDKKGNLWISSQKGGLTRYRNGKFTAYNTRTGLFSDEIFCTLGDNQDNIWVSSPRGIGRIEKKVLNDFAEGRINSIQCQVYVDADGMKTDECFGEWQPAGWRAKDGSLWFATKKGAVKINPKTFKQNKIKPPVYFEKVIADQKTYLPGQTIVLKPGTDNLEFYYTALSFLVPERVLFKYKLEGYDHDWINAKTRRIAYYTKLPPGDYTFKVIACNNDGKWNDVGAEASLTLEPYFYQTNWFILLVIVVTIGIGVGAYRIRVLQLLKREKELQLRVDEAVAKVKVLGGLIPICANCKKIRNDKGYWDQLERYIQEHSEAKFSHGICPECMVKLYPDVHRKVKRDVIK